MEKGIVYSWKCDDPPAARLLAKITSVPSGEKNGCWSVLPVQSSWGWRAGLVTPGGVENSSLDDLPGHECRRRGAGALEDDRAVDAGEGSPGDTGDDREYAE